jgi:cell division protein FtsL
MNGRMRSALSAFGPGWWLAAFLVATLWVWQRYTVVRVGHRIERLQTHLAELERVRDALLAEDAALSSRGRIEEIAISRLGLTPTAENQRVRFSCTVRPDGAGSVELTTSPRLSQAGADRVTRIKDF